MSWRGIRRFPGARSYDQSSDPLKGGISLPPDSSNLDAEIGRSDNDQRHRLVFSGTWQSNWWKLQFAPIVSYSSGAPFNVTLGIDENLDGFKNERPPGVARNSGSKTHIPTLNAVREGWCADDPDEATPCLAAIEGSLDEPNFLQMDLRIARAFAMGQTSIEGFVQIFNLFDRANLGWVDGELTSETFGEPQVLIGPPRIVELGVRFGF